MLKDKILTYISLFSCAGVGCFGFKKAGFECIATNELIERRINVQKFNDKCKFDSGYICDDITTEETKNKIFAEIKKWEKMGNDKVDVLIATPPCQGMSVANHKKAENEIIRNSLVVESVHLVQKINPRFFIFENVAAFMKTGCTAPDGSVKAIGDVIYEELGEKYIIASRILNFKNYGSNSSRTRTVVIGVNRDVKVPDKLNAKLRDYQVEGFEFFNTLANYNFGGILADEMGLGKTVQTLSFLLCQKDKKSIVITPTSLIFNWKSEFEKFTPDIKLGIAYSSKSQREKILENHEEYNVVLTSYGTYKNDIEKYKNINFNYCIIDEAQNIKNPESIITKAIKEVNADVKFALTGTPIENNLMELWSIFDFVMPGYLYNKKKFEKIFANNEKNHCQLKNLIKPFMLRRTKKEVVDELPDKIEQKFYVELEKEHKRAYRGFVNLIKRRILENNEDNMTVFSYLKKLRQLSIAPEIIVKNYKGKNSKLEILINLIKQESDRKILVFSQFTKVLKMR